MPFSNPKMLHKQTRPYPNGQQNVFSTFAMAVDEDEAICYLLNRRLTQFSLES